MTDNKKKTYTFFFSAKQKQCTQDMDAISSICRPCSLYVNGKEYTEMKCTENAKSNWDDAKVVAVFHSRTEFTIT